MKNIIKSVEDKISSAKKTNQKVGVNDRFLLSSLRGLGYDAISAILELTDNSIDAGATKIRILFDSKEKKLVISDNGIGMDYSTINEAMNFGADREYQQSDIGNFGSGLKLSLINLLDIEDKEHLISIISSSEKESSEVLWAPIHTGFEYSCNIIENLKLKGTTITIDKCIGFQLANLKRHLGMIYYHVLKNNDIEIVVGNNIDNEEKILATDPLYRDKVTLTNKVTASVGGHEIEILAVSLDNNLERNFWDINKRAEDGKWSPSKGGCYVLYGDRYVEYGGTLNATTYDPWMNHTRIEFSIPKDLTSLFEVKVNKTQGLNLSEFKNEATDDLRRKIKDCLNWGKRIRKDTAKITTEEEKDSSEKILKSLNDSARKAKFLKPSFVETEQPKLVQDKEKVKKEKTKTDALTPKIRQTNLFDLKFADLYNTGVLWHLGYENKKFVITLNNSHVFYTEIYSKLSDEIRTDFIYVLGSLALAQYETMKKEKIDSINTDYFWEDFWGTVSMKLRHLITA